MKFLKKDLMSWTRACQVHEILTRNKCKSICHDGPEEGKMEGLVKQVKDELIYYLIQFDKKFKWESCY